MANELMETVSISNTHPHPITRWTVVPFGPASWIRPSTKAVVAASR